MSLANILSRQPDSVELELDGVNDYEPNTLFSFMNTERAFHGVQEITDEALDGQRRLSLNMYVSFNSDLVEALLGNGLQEFGLANEW